MSTFIPPPPTPQGPPQQQQQPQQQQLKQPLPQQEEQKNVNLVIDNILKVLNSLPEKHKVQVFSTLKNSNILEQPCSLNHIINSLPDDETNIILMELKRAYSKQPLGENEEEYPRLFDIFCHTCCNLKFGLVPIMSTKHFDTSFPCTNFNSQDGKVQYNIGPFMAASNPYKAKDEFPNHSSQKLGINRGCIILPTSTLLMQILSMNIQFFSKGIKVIQLMTKEENVTYPEAYVRFIVRNKDNLNNGYYIIDESVNVCDLNKKEGSQGGAKYSDLTSNYLEFMKQFDPNATTTSTGFNYIAQIDDHYDKDNIFQNGVVMKPVLPKETADPQHIKMRVFDINPVLIKYLQSILNIDMHFKSRLDKKSKTYLDNMNSNDSFLVDRVFHDIITMAFAFDHNHDNLSSVPPLNKECVYATQNILIINEDGHVIMTQKDQPGTNNSCSVFDKLITQRFPNKMSKIVTTASTTLVNSQGILPQTGLDSQFLPDLAAAAGTNTNQNNQDDAHIKIIEEHKDRVGEYQNKIKANSDNLYNYFEYFKDDSNSDVLIMPGQEMTLQFASLMYPEKIYRNSSNVDHHSLDYSVINKDSPVVDQSIIPNVTYVRNVGFVTLTNVCDFEKLKLKNSAVRLNNLINRCSNNPTYKRYSNTDSTNNLDDHGRIVNNLSIVSYIPKKLKTAPEGVINICGNNSAVNYDYNAYSKYQGCNSNFEDYLTKYRNDSCQR